MFKVARQTYWLKMKNFCIELAQTNLATIFIASVKMAAFTSFRSLEQGQPVFDKLEGS